MPSVKIYFNLDQDEDDYPPVAVESLWAEPGAVEGEFIVDNVPFFIRDVTMGDAVVVREEDGCRWFNGVISRSHNSLIRVVFFDRNCIEEVGKSLATMGCSTEFSREHNLMAVNIPGETELTDVQAYLKSEAESGRLDYEEPILRQ